jgi:hypothetical protein
MSAIESAKKLRRCNTALTFSTTVDVGGAVGRKFDPFHVMNCMEGLFRPYSVRKRLSSN